MATIKIELNRKEKDKNIIIKNLQNYILMFKGNHFIVKNDETILDNKEQLKFIEENILKKLILKNSQKIAYNLLYKASKDGDNGLSFHNRCDNFSPTLSIFKTKKNIIFGGFTTQNWNCDQEYKKDIYAFCFQLNNKKIYNIKNDININAICCRKDNGPSFYDGKSGWAFIWSVGNFFTSDNNHTCTIQLCGYDNVSQDYEINNGEQYYNIAEIEVFQIIIINEH